MFFLNFVKPPVQSLFQMTNTNAREILQHLDPMDAYTGLRNVVW